MVEETRAPNFSERLHALRTSELATLPSGARTVLHGGGAGGWYFTWFDEQYPEPVERHIAVEAFSPRPDDLPENVEWLVRTLGDLSGVEDGSIDLVFAGQVIEHLWADDVAGFLLESHRVLRDDGHLVLDSPNRRVTEGIGWLHDQHTAELTVEEMVELAGLAGFEVEAVRGVLLGYDRDEHHFLELEDERMAWDERARLAADRPEDSFVWWVVARKAPGSVSDGAALRERVHGIHDAFRARRLRQLNTTLRIDRGPHRVPSVVAGAGDPSLLFHGPYFPVDHGEWRARFTLATDGSADTPQTPVAFVDVVNEGGTKRRARRDVLAGELGNARWTTVELPFTLDEMLMGVELRAYSTGAAPVWAQLQVELLRPQDVPSQGEAPALPQPEPRSVELLGTLAARAGARVRGLAGR